MGYLKKHAASGGARKTMFDNFKGVVDPPPIHPWIYIIHKDSEQWALVQVETLFFLNSIFDSDTSRPVNTPKFGPLPLL